MTCTTVVEVLNGFCGETNTAPFGASAAVTSLAVMGMGMAWPNCRGFVLWAVVVGVVGAIVAVVVEMAVEVDVVEDDVE
jgi:hypothetical protein